MTLDNKKVFGIFAFFLLPDDFVGNDVDAMNLMLEYHKSKQENPECVERNETDDLSVESLWGQFLSGLEGDKRLTAFLSLNKYNPNNKSFDKQAWEDIDPLTKNQNNG